MSGWATWDVESHLQLMDQGGIATAMLSVSSPGTNFGDDKAARELTREVNEFGAGLVRDHLVDHYFGHGCPDGASYAWRHRQAALARASMIAAAAARRLIHPEFHSLSIPVELHLDQGPIRRFEEAQNLFASWCDRALFDLEVSSLFVQPGIQQSRRIRPLAECREDLLCGLSDLLHHSFPSRNCHCNWSGTGIS